MRINITQPVWGKLVIFRLMIIANWFLDHYGQNSEIPSQPYAIIISYRLITLREGWLDYTFLGHGLITNDSTSGLRPRCIPVHRCTHEQRVSTLAVSSHRYYKTGYNRHRLAVRSASVYLWQCAKSTIVHSLTHYEIIIIDELNDYLRSYILWL